MSRGADASFGNIRITRSLRRISWISLSCMFVDFILRRYFSGNPSTAKWIFYTLKNDLFIL
jgi:hypothetical protein